MFVLCRPVFSEAADCASLLSSFGFDLSLTGFDDLEIAALTGAGNARLTDPDDIPEAPEQATSLPGDIWILGKHRMICGDPTSLHGH